MSLVRFEPFRGFEGIGRRINGIFGENQIPTVQTGYAPKVDISEDDKNLYIHAEIPGIPKENLKVSISEDRILTIQGEKKREEKTEEKNYVRLERSYGTFTRSFYMPENIDTENVLANFANGVL